MHDDTGYARSLFQSRVSRSDMLRLLRERSLHSSRRYHQSGTVTECSVFSCTVVNVRDIFAEGWKARCDQFIWDFDQSIKVKDVREVR